MAQNSHVVDRMEDLPAIQKNCRQSIRKTVDHLRDNLGDFLISNFKLNTLDLGTEKWELKGLPIMSRMETAIDQMERSLFKITEQLTIYRTMHEDHLENRMHVDHVDREK